MDIKLNRYFYKKRFWASLLLVQFLLFYILSKVEYAIIFFENFFEVQKYFHQKIFSKISFSVGDFLYCLLIATFLYFIFKLIKNERRNKFLLRLIILLNILYLTYQIFWGMLYFQKPLINKLPQQEIEIAQIKILTLEYLEKCKQTRKFVKEDQNGVFLISDLNSIKNEILKNQTELPLFINNKKGTNLLSFKSSLFEPLMSYTGILGYYNPFTAEAQFNAKLPSTYIPFTLSHESAHQLGYAREQEANFIGFLIGENSSNIDLKYSTEYFVLKSLLNSLNTNDLEFTKEVLEKYSPEMQRDRQAEKNFIKKHEGYLVTFFALTNDLFLKSNQQDGSITYSYFVALLLRYHLMSTIEHKRIAPKVRS